MCIIVVVSNDEVDIPSADSPPHVGSTNGVSPSHIDSTTGIHIDAEGTHCLNNATMNTDVTTTAKLRSELRQTLSHLLSISCEINDNDLLSSVISAVQQQVDVCTAAVGGRTIPQCNKRRVRKRAKKSPAKRRRVRGNTSADVDS